jgi:hypothetical protein
VCRQAGAIIYSTRYFSTLIDSTCPYSLRGHSLVQRQRRQRGNFGLVSSASRLQRAIMPIPLSRSQNVELATCSFSLFPSFFCNSPSTLYISASVHRLPLSCKYFRGSLTATRSLSRQNLPLYTPFSRSTASTTAKVSLCWVRKYKICTLPHCDKGYSQVMPLIVENSQTMPSPESRSVKRPSESASSIHRFCRFPSTLKISRVRCDAVRCGAVRCGVGFSPPHERSRKINLRTSRHVVLISLSTRINTTSIQQHQKFELFNIILAITTNLHHDGRNSISSSTYPPTTRRRTARPHTIHR